MLVRAAEAAVEAGDFVTASKELAAALELQPDDETTRRRVDEVNERAEAAMLDQLRDRGQKQLDSLDYEEASRTWTRVAHLAPADDLAHARAAQAYRELPSGGRNAVEHARKAVALSPNSVEYRLLLARSYLVNGMKPAAKLELEAAVRLAPTDTQVYGLLRSVSKSLGE